MNHTKNKPLGIDNAIQIIQTYLYDNLNWGEIDVFGRVYKNPINKKGLTIEAYSGDDSYVDVFTNDTKNANIFFIEDDVHETKDGFRFTNKVKIVFMINLKKVYPDLYHRADIEAQIEAIELIRKKTGFTFQKIEKGIKQCLGEFQTEEIKLNDMHPYHVFAITGEITYQISCLTNK